MESQHFCLRWNNYQSSITSAFENLRDDEDFVDVTIACDGKSLKAHRVVLSACSPYFRELLKSTPCKHPVIVLQDVAFADLDALVEFIYHGEVNVHQRNLTSFLKTAEVLRVSGLTQQADGREDSPLSQLASSNGRALGGDQLFNLSPAGRSPPTATSPVPTSPHSSTPTNGSTPTTTPSSVPNSATVNQLLRRAVAVAEASKRLQRNSIPTPPLGTDQNDVDHPVAKRPRSINNNSENGPITNSHLDREWDRERERDRERDREWEREDRLCETDINANPADLTNHQLTPTDFSAKNSYRKVEVKREDRDRERDRDRDSEQSRSPSSRMDKGPPSTSSTGEHEDLDSSAQSHHNPPFLSPVESKLFAAATAGSFNFSMAALAADTALAGLQNLQTTTDGLAGTSTPGMNNWTYGVPPPMTGGINDPQECPFCRRTFSCYYSLKRHFQDKHERSDTLYKCEFCQRSYRTKNSLTTHKSLQHRGSAGMLKRLMKSVAVPGALGQPQPQ
ncbi:broad-complex core protein isoforms 1/2/3/4/5 isoform X5 [Frankliniella occidentalis]|uniref:Broad-complex core protein isoforms 1/2/3/4/5 isoform X5 n=1 Tax=Frankliniella occidentalis TaxID=133901 RepID=A0A6J1S424_FRAOC|nr:broad-complex core protein isoforms 1/2/3/4/5 isoform X5 [Frankliniella occidentalis]